MKKLPLHPAVHPFLRLQLGPGPLGRGLHQHLGHRGGHGPRRPHRRGPDGGLLRGAGGDGSLYRESHGHRGEILHQTPVPALRQRPGSTGKISTPWKSTWPAPAAGATGWTTNSPSPASPRLKITAWVHRSEWEEAGGVGRNTSAALRVVESARAARIASDNPKSRRSAGRLSGASRRCVSGWWEMPDRPWNACSFPSRPVPVLHCPSLPRNDFTPANQLP